MIRKILSLFDSQQEKLEAKPRLPLKQVTKFPAKILFIDQDSFVYSYNSKDPKQIHWAWKSYVNRLSEPFADEIDNNLYSFCFARDFSEALALIQFHMPDLIICELVISTPMIVEENEFFSNITQFGYGLKIFEILQKLNLDYTIPVIMFSGIAKLHKHESKAKEFGAFDCIERYERDSNEKLKQAVRKALRLDEGESGKTIYRKTY